MVSGLSDRGSVLVTGGAGFIGAAVAAQLVDAGFRVAVLDRDISPTRRCALNAIAGLRGRVELLEIDVRDVAMLSRAMASLRPEIVFHLASVSVIEDAGKSPSDAFDVIAVGTQRVLEACRREAAGARVVVASTDKVYGDFQGQPYREDFQLKPDGLYEAAKAAAEMTCRAYNATYGLSVSVVRLCNVIGPRDFNVHRRLVPRALFSMFGNELPTPPVVYRRSLGHLRAFVGLDDVVDALCVVGMEHCLVDQVINMMPAVHESPYSIANLTVQIGARIQHATDPERAAAILHNGVQVIDVAKPAMVAEISTQRVDGTRCGSLIGRRSRPISYAIEQAVHAFLSGAAWKERTS